jgi:sarcosine oxidase
MQNHTDVAIVGGGAWGCAAAWSIAASGRSVLLLEQFELGHVRGSSHGGSRIIRYTHPETDYATMMPATFELWRRLEAESGSRLIAVHGGLFMAQPDDPFLVGCRKTLDELGMSYQIFDAIDVTDRWPGLRLAEDEVALFQADSGTVAASASVLAMAGCAMQAGAQVVEHARVVSVEDAGADVRIRYEQGAETREITAERVIVTAGPWAAELLVPLLPEALPLTVTHQQVAYFRVEDSDAWSPQRCPIYIFTAEPHVYGFPVFESPGLIKVARELNSPCDQNAPRAIDGEALKLLSGTVAQRLIGVDPTPLEVTPCLYTETPSRDFIIDRHPKNPNLVFATGDSGRGFKFAPAIGQLLDYLSRSEPDQYDHPFWRDRFSLRAAKSAGGRPDLFPHAKP